LGHDAKGESKFFRNMTTLVKWIDGRRIEQTLRNSGGNPANSDSLKGRNALASFRFWIYIMLNSSI